MHRLTLHLATALSVALFASAVHAAPLTFVPEVPVAFSAVHAKLFVDSCTTVRNAHLDADTIVVQLDRDPCENPGPMRPVFVPLGRLPAGDWTVGVKVNDEAIVDATPLRVGKGRWFANTPAAGDAKPVYDVSGVWGIEGRPGHGVTLTQTGNGILAGLVFTYAANRDPEWFSLQSRFELVGGEWRGEAFRTSAAGWTSTADGEPAYESIASARLSFWSSTQANLCLIPSTSPPLAPGGCLRLFRYALN